MEWWGLALRRKQSVFPRMVEYNRAVLGIAEMPRWSSQHIVHHNPQPRPRRHQQLLGLMGGGLRRVCPDYYAEPFPAILAKCGMTPVILRDELLQFWRDFGEVDRIWEMLTNLEVSSTSFGRTRSILGQMLKHFRPEIGEVWGDIG